MYILNNQQLIIMYILLLTLL